MAIEDKRHLERRAFKKTIDYSINLLEEGELKMVHLKADSIDISNSGIGIRTDYPLEPGRVLMFDNFNSDIGYMVGIVQWSLKDNIDNRNRYRAGIKFL